MPKLSFKDSIELRDILIPDDSSNFFINVKSKTHIGRIRDENQDNFSILLPPKIPEGVLGIISVADGLGGQKGGAEASKIAVKSLEKTLNYSASTRSTREMLKNAFDSANHSVFSKSKNPNLSGMGTTLTTAVITSNGVTIGHVGDSRAYLFRNSKLYQMTNDHTWIANQINQGKLTKKDAKIHPKKNMLTRAIGIKNNVETDLVSFSLNNNDTLLICSDGLHGQLKDSEIINILNKKDPEIIVDSLVKSANKSGGIDNVTVLIVNFSSQNPINQAPYGFLSLFTKEEKKSPIKKTLDRLGSYTDLEPLNKLVSRNIYKTWDHTLKKQVIVKTDLNIENKNLKNQFDIHNEAKCHSKINHPNIVNLINYKLENQPPYLVLEYLSGGSLKEKITAEGPLKTSEMILITKEIIKGLDAIHQKNIIHCDLKPENILFDHQGVPKLIDFSLARNINKNKNISRTGSVLWVSPEQWHGQNLDIRSEIYTLGGLMYFMVTGRFPFSPDSSAENEKDSVREKHLYSFIPKATSLNNLIPINISYCIAKCLAKIPERRFQNTKSLIKHLDTYQDISFDHKEWKFFSKPNSFS
tara:strand:+ start:525 stop:2276 length:1752 start_codon:yes stop_codon:yes gene_type:complete